MPRVIVSDASCLILFHKIDSLDLLKKVFGEILITEIVSKEYGEPLPEWITAVSPATKLAEGLSTIVDEGEAASIALASEQDNSLLIIDELKGRRVAREMGIQITGSLGVIVAAKKKGHLVTIKPILEKIEETNFRVSEELIQRLLKKVDEI